MLLCRRQRRPRAQRPTVGHHSHRPVKHEKAIATPIQPTIVRPTPGSNRLPWSTCSVRTSPLRLSATSSTRAVAGSR